MQLHGYMAHPACNLIHVTKIFSKNFKKSVDKLCRLCYTIITEREGKPTKPERTNTMKATYGMICNIKDIKTIRTEGVADRKSVV